MKKEMKKFAFTAFLFILCTLVVEVAILITTKATGWDHDINGRPWAVAAHVHLMVLGAVWHFLLLLIEKNFRISSQKLAKPAYIVFLIGLTLVVLLILYKGFTQLVYGQTITAITDGGAAVSHTTLFVGLFMWCAVIWKAVAATGESDAKSGDIGSTGDSDANSEIVYKALNPVLYKDYEVDFHYTADFSYRFEQNVTPNGFSASLTKTPLETPYERRFTDLLFPPYYEKCEAIGAFSGDKLIGVVETRAEYFGRLELSELSVTDGFKRRGIGKRLMQFAKRRAEREGYRCLILETQSTNAPAIAFYLSEGFELIGYDRCAYGNDDEEKGEIRLDFAWFIDFPKKS